MSLFNYIGAAAGIALAPFTGGSSLTLTAGAMANQIKENKTNAEQAAKTNEKSAEQTKQLAAAGNNEIDEARLNS